MRFSAQGNFHSWDQTGQCDFSPRISFRHSRNWLQAASCNAATNRWIQPRADTPGQYRRQCPWQLWPVLGCAACPAGSGRGARAGWHRVLAHGQGQARRAHADAGGHFQDRRCIGVRHGCADERGLRPALSLGACQADPVLPVWRYARGAKCNAAGMGVEPIPGGACADTPGAQLCRLVGKKRSLVTIFLNQGAAWLCAL